MIIFALLFPNIVSVISILGCFFTVLLGFVFPGMMYLEVFQTDLSLSRKIFAILVMSFGILGGINGLYSTLSGGGEWIKIQIIIYNGK